MTDPANQDLVPARLRCGIVVRVRQDASEIVTGRRLCSVRYATPFPSPRTERVSPGHLVAIATASDGSEALVWRWYEAVVLGAEAGLSGCGSPRTAKSWPGHGPRTSLRSPEPVPTCSPACPAPTGGSPGAPLPARRTPTSSWTRSSSSTPSAISGTPWYWPVAAASRLRGLRGGGELTGQTRATGWPGACQALALARSCPRTYGAAALRHGDVSPEAEVAGQARTIYVSPAHRCR